MMTRATVDVLIPTCNRACALAVTLASLSTQTFTDFRVVISDQSDGAAAFDKEEVQAVMRQMQATGREVLALRHLPRRGMAEQRAFLLSHASAPYCLFLDDDVLLENDVLERMHAIIVEQQCGFVGSALHGMSFLDDIRPHQQHIEFWDGKVQPERVTPDSPAWARHHLHSAANLFHVQARLGLTRATTRLYRVAWIGGCVMFDTAKLRETGGFDFWSELPSAHCGEDVLAQLRVMERFGGCGMIPSGAYHLELPTTVTTRDIDAPKVLPISPTADTA
ncbi:glycosyltransferase family A protein [Noviherbaspirillum sp.]|uniref:glycosyltransferase family 2 protein n=1 Tax=Noviherbaspirillum sp. TaxID=1926288 RepID=UPI002D2D264A|nr:glycosyltransferase family A protein [Noviherbaspirillum sp.]HZW21136.1 glycosyltransferase family A protein [Noviherbaspirillum sp.]